MSWQDRLRSTIDFTAPDGTKFSARWQGDDIEFAKRVAQYDVPLVDGTLVQDMGSKGVSFPLTIDFEGEDNDTTAFAFCRTLGRQRGTWTVVHPVYGSLTLQPIGPFILSAQPTQSGNITRVAGPWIEPLPPESVESIAQLGQRLQQEVANVNASAAEQFSAAVDLSNPESAAAILSSGTQAMTALQTSPLAGLLSGAQDLKSQFDAGIQSVQTMFSTDPLDLAAIAGQVQELVELPALCQAEIGGLIMGFVGFAQSILSVIPTGEDYATEPATAANVAMSELLLSSALSGLAIAVSSSTPETRDQALKAIDDSAAAFTDVRDALDDVQTSSAGAYVSASQTTASLSRLDALIAAYLMGMLWDLAIARRFILDLPRAAIEVAITEYGVTDRAQIDDVYAMFIRTNGLLGNNVILLPAGFETVIYEGAA